jgi:capsular polysaccharide biosynthesis protein
MSDEQLTSHELPINQRTDEVSLLNYVLILWKRRWSIIIIVAIIVLISVIVNILMKQTFESEALLKIGTYQSNPLESIEDLNRIMNSEPSLEQLGKILGWNNDPKSLSGIFNITDKVAEKNEAKSKFLQIKGRSDTPEKAKAVTEAVQNLIIARNQKLFEVALAKFKLEIEQIKREKQATEVQLNYKQKELARFDVDVKYYENEIKKRDKAVSEGQGRIVESYINLWASAKTQREDHLIEIENLKQALLNFDIKFQQKDFESKYQTMATAVEINASLPQTKIAPNRKQNVLISSVLAAFLAILYALIAEFVEQHKADFKSKNNKKNEPAVI